LQYAVEKVGDDGQRTLKRTPKEKALCRIAVTLSPDGAAAATVTAAAAAADPSQANADPDLL
jgi:hypothetical protein